MGDNTKILDTHTLYCHSNSISADEITKIVKEAVNAIARIGGPKETRPISTKFFMNGVKHKKTGVTDYYIFITDTRVYNVLIGSNPNGTTRNLTEKIPDASWNPPKVPLVDALEALKSDQLSRGLNPKSWADEDIIVMENAQLEALYLSRPTVSITVRKPPIYTHPRMVYIEESDNREDERPWQEVAGKGRIAIERARMQKVAAGSGLVPYALITNHRIPDGITKEAIRAIFADFSTSHEGAYPKVDILQNQREARNNRRAVIRFHAGNTDGIFAWAVMREFSLKNPVTGKPVTISTWYCSADILRDLH